METVAMLGLGAMGSRMAQRLLEAGRKVVVYSRRKQSAEACLKRGARFCATAREAALLGDVVISMVTDDRASRSVWCCPEHGALLGLRPGTVALESSTLSVPWVRELHTKVLEKGASFLDAPVAGSRPQAEAGVLIYTVGGEKKEVERVDSLLRTMGGAVHHVGPVGSGASMKLAINALFGVQVAALAETLEVLRQAGLARDVAVDVLGQTPVMSPALQGMGALMVAQQYAPMFPLSLVEKDFRYAVEHAALRGTSVPVSQAAHGVYARACEADLGEENIAGVVKLYERT